MKTSFPVAAPAGYVPLEALAFAEADGAAVTVSRTRPLPVETELPAATSSAIGGTLAASGPSGAFLPDLGRPVWLSLSGEWAGRVTLERSIDGGASWLPATLGGLNLAWSANLNEAVTEEYCAGASYRLRFEHTAGALTFEVRQ